MDDYRVQRTGHGCNLGGAGMSAKNDGGPAFPQHYCENCNDAFESPNGMTLRDYFAGQALAGMATLFAQAGGSSEDIAKANAEVSYLMADAMLKERETNE